MIISFKEISNGIRENGDSEYEWLYHEILQSLPKEIIEQAQIRREVNVQLMIDNMLVEPQLLQDILSNIDKYIDEQAEHKLKAKFEELQLRFNDVMYPLEEATKDATRKIREEFGIKDDEDRRCE